MGAGKDVGTGDAPKSETVWGTLGTLPDIWIWGFGLPQDWIGG